jgi:hypothetical protein
VSQNMSIRKFVVTSFLAAALAVSAFAQGSTSTSTTTQTFLFPPVGLGSTETAQVNVVNIASASSSGTAASCTGSVAFANSAGTVIGKATTFTVGTGQIASVSLPFGTSGFSGTRGEVVATLTRTVTRPSTAPCSLVFSLETFATATGETHVVLTNSAADGPGNGGFGR